MKKSLSVILSAVILIGTLLSINVNAFAANYIYYPVSGTYDYTYATEVVELVNQERINAGVDPLAIDEDLTNAAMLRASETSILFDHIRPNGEACFTASPNMHGENIAMASYKMSPQELVDLWMNSPGHRANILREEFKSIGVGSFYDDYGYCYWTQAFSYYEASGNPQTSGTRQVTVNIQVIDISAPSAPEEYNIIGTGNGGSLLYLDWEDIVNADGYRVYIISGDKEYLKGDVTDSQFKFTDLTPGWNYTVMVVAYNENGSTSSKTTICAAPATMDGVTAKQSGDKLSISWSKETCTGYVVQWSTDSSFKNVAGTKYISSPSSTSCVANVSKWENYYVRVRAYKTYNGMTAYGDFSKAVKATILPGAVTGFDIIGTGNKGSLLYLDWEGQSNTDGYRVYIISGDKEYLKGTTKDSQFKFTDLTPGWNYNVMVVAYNENGSTSFKTTICAAPVTMTENDFSAKASGNKLNISWDKQTCTGYIVQWSMDSTFTRIAGTKYIDGAWNTSYSVTASNPQNYYVRVRAYKTYNGMTAYGDFSSAVKAK